MKLVLIGSVTAAGALALAGCGGGDDSTDIQAFCDKVAELEATGDPFANVGEGDVEGVRAALEEAQGLLGEVADVAPEEIQADVESAQQFFDDFVAAVQDAETPEEIGTAATQFQDQAADFEAASERLNQFTEENCDINLDGATGATGPEGG